MRRRRREHDAGFTLIELVMVITIMGIITVPLADFWISYFRSTTQTEQRLSVSHDIQISAAYLSQDVANTGLRTAASYTPVQSVWVNSMPAPCKLGLGNAALLLKWDNWTAANGMGTRTTQSAAYIVEPDGALHRVACSESTVVSDVIGAHNYVSGSASVACSPVACTNSVPPSTITLTFQITAGPNDTSATTATLTGQRRQSSS